MKRVLIIVFLFFFLLTFYVIINRSLGLFESEQNVAINTDIGKWQVLINNASIKTDTSFQVTNVKVSNEENVLEDRLAPGTEGYFDVTIVPNDTSVAFRYDLTYSWSGVDNSYIQFLNIAETNGNTIVRTGENTYSGIFSLANIENDDTVNIRFYVQWINNDNNNASDSAYGLEEKQLVIPVTIHLEQYLGETLVPYSG